MLLAPHADSHLGPSRRGALHAVHGEGARASLSWETVMQVPPRVQYAQLTADGHRWVGVM